MANSMDPDQTVASGLGLHFLLRLVCSNTEGYYGILFLSENLELRDEPSFWSLEVHSSKPTY